MSRSLLPHDIEIAAQRERLDPAALKAVIAVESGGSGFLPDGRLKILFERHHLWKRLQSRNLNPAHLAEKHPDLCGPKWERRYYVGGAGEWNRVQAVLDWASTYDGDRFESYKKAAYESCSWGLFQLMGFNYAAVGYSNIYAMKHAFEDGEHEQLAAILRWMDGNGLLAKLRRKDWTGFVWGYNGPGQVPVYSARLLLAYQKAKRV